MLPIMTPVSYIPQSERKQLYMFALFMTLILVSNSTIKMLIINSSKGDLHSYGNEIVHCKCLMNILHIVLLWNNRQEVYDVIVIVHIIMQLAY